MNGLQFNSTTRVSLAYIRNKYLGLNEYFKYLLLRPCDYIVGNSSTISTRAIDEATRTQLLSVSPNQWFINQYTQNYIGDNLPATACPK